MERKNIVDMFGDIIDRTRSYINKGTDKKWKLGKTRNLAWTSGSTVLFTELGKEGGDLKEKNESFLVQGMLKLYDSLISPMERSRRQ